MKRDHTARRSRPFAASATSAPSCSVLLRQQTKHSVTDRSFRSPHHSVAIRVADDETAPVHIHTRHSTIPRRDHQDHSRWPEFPVQDHGHGTRSRARQRGGVTL